MKNDVLSTGMWKRTYIQNFFSEKLKEMLHLRNLGIDAWITEAPEYDPLNRDLLC
jgi:hypothetical protein